MKSTQQRSRSDLVRIATEAMVDVGWSPNFRPSVGQQLAAIDGPGRDADPRIRDLTALHWCSIDNDDSLDLDQLTACETLAGGAVKIYVAVADVDALVKKGSAIDAHARINTTSVYTSARVFPMLPERLSTDLTSLNPGEDRLADRAEMIVAADGSFTPAGVHRALVHNKAKLAYDAVSAWIDGAVPCPTRRRAVPGMDAQLRTQDDVGAALARTPACAGFARARDLSAACLFDGERVVDIRQQVQNRARQLIEELMIATNTCTAQFLARGGGASLRRVSCAHPNAGSALSTWPGSSARRCRRSPIRARSRPFLPGATRPTRCAFPDLSLVIVKLMGSGEYVVEHAGRSADRPLRPGGARLHALHRTEPPLSRPDHAAHAQGHPERDCSRPTAWANCRRWHSIARSRKMPRRRSSGGCASPRPRCCSNPMSASLRRDRHRPLDAATPGCASSTRRPRAGSRPAWPSSKWVSHYASSSCPPTSSAGSSTSCSSTESVIEAHAGAGPATAIGPPSTATGISRCLRLSAGRSTRG